ncbi:DUF2680 domain-containing protein [Moorella sp. Hama-1]|uniref:DUF2680 domain-containing protein n=1 Tax=Moorella sp. Hama-1 TaxID=2138101 RepID=UPI000D6546F0|nr:DUF2680 domain-containing protein [Moorella sp. Hama-1]MDN5361866.1 hypothetical protein [Moorella sp. (in: firmicutes)]BCV21068.1 hypothetical protein hamaS1_11370 [Moorella sp. Hama-1]
MTKGTKILAAVAAPLILGGLLVVSQPASSRAAAGAPAQAAPAVSTPAFCGAGLGPGQGLGLGRSLGGMIATLSNTLGIDVAQLRAERQAGKSLADIAAEHGVDKSQLVDKVTAERKQLLEDRVAAGQITQEQANYCLENMQQRMEQNLERTTIGPNGQGRGGWRTGGQGNGGPRLGIAAGPGGQVGQGAGFSRGPAGGQQ